MVKYFLVHAFFSNLTVSVTTLQPKREFCPLCKVAPSLLENTTFVPMRSYLVPLLRISIRKTSPTKPNERV